MDDMSRYAALPSRNWLRMLKSNFSAAAADPDSDIVSEGQGMGAALSARVLIRVHLLIRRVVPFESALERICLDFVNIIMLASKCCIILYTVFNYYLDGIQLQ